MEKGYCCKNRKQDTDKIRLQASGIRRQASGVRHKASGIRRQASGVRHKVSVGAYPAFLFIRRHPYPEFAAAVKHAHEV